MSGTEYTRTPNLQLYKPTYKADGENWGDHINWNADTLDGLFGTGPSGTFLPIAGGQMQGPLTVTATGGTTPRSVQDRWRNLRTPRDWGAVGDGTTDDTAAFTAMFTQLATEGGGRIYIPGSFYLAGAVTVPDGAEVFGNFTPTSMQYNWSQSYFQAPGSKLILGAGMTLGRACILRNLMVIANNLPRSNPTTVPGANALVAQMAANGNGINLAKDNCLLDSVQVLGFNMGIVGSNDPGTDRHMLRNIHGDCIHGIRLDTGGDTSHIIGAHFWPYLTSGVNNLAAFGRSGNGIYLRNCIVQVEHCTVYGYQNCFVVDTGAATISQCWADGIGAAGSVGFASTGACGPLQLSACSSVANVVGVHHAPSNGAVCTIDSSCSLQGGGPGGNTPATGMSIAVLADGHGPVVSLGAYYSGGQAAFWLGPNSGPSRIIGNTFDDATSGWDHIWNVDPAVLPVLAKYSNSVINSTRSFTEQVTGTPAQGGVAVYDQLPQGLSNTTIGASGAAAGFFNNLQVAPGYNLFLAQSGNGTNQNHWGFQVLGGGTGALSGVAWTDNFGANTEWLHVTRSGYVPQQITLTAPTISLAGAVGATSLNGTPVGNTTPSTGAFTTLSSSGAVTGAGFTSLFASPPAIGGTAAAAGRFTAVTATQAQGGLGAAIFANGAGAAAFGLQDTTQGADAKLWDFLCVSASLHFRALNDTGGSATEWLAVTRTGYVPQAITLTAPQIVNAGATVISAAGGPTIRAGTGAATGTQPKGSLWLRTDGAAGSTLYVTQGGGTWAAVAGV